MKLLLIEDDAGAADYIVQGLNEDGHVIDHVTDGKEGLYMATSGEFSVIIVDRRLPSLDGLSVVKAVRAAGVKTPVLFLTTMDGIDDRVEGLDAGGDDYLVKPFAFSELRARINALARRPVPKETEEKLSAGDLTLDLMKRRAFRAGVSIELQPREFRLLEYLVRNAGRIVTRTMLLEQVWDFNFDPKTNVVETHISRLRAKVDKPFEKNLIQTVRGSGYTINVD